MKNSILHVIFSLLIVFSFSAIYSQNYKNIDFKKIDDIAFSTPDSIEKDVNKLTNYLTKDLNTDYEKARVIFSWICDNINYSFGAKYVNADIILKTRIAKCAGYSYLFNDMCKIAKINSLIISGYTLTRPNEIGNASKKSNHAWNVIFIEKDTILIDATWGAGYYDYVKKKFLKEFKPVYFDMNATDFSLNHYPNKDQKIFSLLPYIDSVNYIDSIPLYYCEYFKRDDRVVYPTNGILDINLDSTRILKFKFTSTYPETIYSCSINNKEYINLNHVDLDIFELVIPNYITSVESIVLFRNNKGIVQYKNKNNEK